MEFNEYQSSIEELKLDTYPEEVVEQFWDFINNVPFIQSLISNTRLRAKDLPRDNEGKIIVDITKPHILEDMDYFRPTAIHFQKTGKLTDLRPNPNPNSEYCKWINEEVRRCYEGYIRQSDGEWITGDMYFFLNYCPIMLTKVKDGKKALRVWDFPEIWEGHYYKFHYILQSRDKGLHGAELAARGKGKAHPYSEKVFTPNGWEIWKNITIGSLLYGDDGKITKVIDIPYDEISDIYEVTLIDGRKIRCTSGHLFKVYNHKNKKEEVKSLQEISKDYIIKRNVTSKTTTGREYNYRIPVCKSVELNQQDIPIDAYTMGVLLGDGCFRNIYKSGVLFTTHIKDLNTYKQLIPYDIIKISNDKYTYKILFNTESIKNFGLWNLKSEDKFIPDCYKYNTKEIRLNVLRGLLDTDGTVTFGVPILTTTSEKLKDDVVFIVRSLGYNCKISSKIPKYKGKEYLRCWNIRIYSEDILFNLERKQNKVYVSNNKFRKYTSIVNIQYIGKEKAKCVTVDNLSKCYLINDFVVTHNSYSLAALMAKRFILGETAETTREVKCLATAYQKEYLVKDGLLNKFQSYIDFCAQNTEFPSKKLKQSLQDMSWKMGYIDLNTGTQKGTLNEVLGVSSKDDESKLRGKRGALIAIEEFGSFPNLLGLYGTLRPSMEEGEFSYGMIYMQGTAGDDDSDFASAQEIMYHPDAYHIGSNKNVYDKEGQGSPKFVFFFGGYLNRKGCYDINGNSNVTKALLEILNNRYIVKHNSSDINAITKAISEIPITPQEAILRTKGNFFPITQLNERIMELDANPNSYDDVYIGNLFLGKSGEVTFKISDDKPIREFPLKDNTAKGALEIYSMPEKDSSGKVYPNRYIAGYDPYDNDQAESMSLGSVFVLDLFTDKLAAEYTGRTNYADEFYEQVRLLCLFYNCKCLYESNKKGTFAYFSRMNCTHLLADTPDYLRDKQLVKYSSFGSNSKGVNASNAINNYANQLIKDWLLKPISHTVVEEGEEKIITVLNLYFLKNRALLKELVLFNPQINVDRIRALGMLMLYREEKIILFQGDLQQSTKSNDTNYLGNSDYFTKNYDLRSKIRRNRV